jgi:hypothetical protein
MPLLTRARTAPVGVAGLALGHLLHVVSSKPAPAPMFPAVAR